MILPSLCRDPVPLLSHCGACHGSLLAEALGPAGAVTRAGLTASLWRIDGLWLASVDAIMIG